MVTRDAATVRGMGGTAGTGCPMCGRDVSLSDDKKSRPFCSSRCKLVDLDRWLSGSYRIPGPPVESSEASNGFEFDQSFERKGDDEP